MLTLAEDIILPPSRFTFRTVFLYVGQGESTLLVAPDGQGGFQFILADINQGAAQGGLDVVRLLEDLLPKENGMPVLDVFMNTHPHNDHLCGIDELRSRIRVREVWHTGFTPSDRHHANYAVFVRLIEEVGAGGGRVWEYRGTRETTAVGAVVLNVLSPADHTKEEIAQLEGEERDCRIHDHCGVMRFGYGLMPKHVLVTGDADKTAWEQYILGPAEYHRDRVPAAVLSAPHHGSRSFFKDGEDDPDPYTRHMELIQPTWVVISSPQQVDSPHGHPHDDALELYRQHMANPLNLRVLGERPECLIYDVTIDGNHALESDNGVLVEKYRLDDGGDGGAEGSSARIEAPYVFTSQLDRGRPMGSGA
jgi:beta-lactamase superfamily II metal-dependent hydrolase